MAAESSTPNRFRQILFCADFSDSADHAFDFALDMAHGQPGVKLHLLHVIPEIEAQFWKSYLYEVEHLDDQAKADMDRKLSEAYLKRVPRTIEVVVVLRAGPEAARILEYADEADIELIIIGRHGRSGVERALFGKVAEKVMRKARCPVLVVPLGERRKSGVENEFPTGPA